MRTMRTLRTMRYGRTGRRLLTALGATVLALATVVLPASPAQAGNWAVTVLDPVPDRLEAGQGYTIGLWVLQHGYHPYEGPDLGPVALKLVDEQGIAVSYPATTLPEPAHYAAAIALPHPGAWTVIGVQGRFADYVVGTLTVPGSLAVLGVPVPLRPSEAEKYWPGAIRPPSVAVDESRDPFAQVQTPIKAVPVQAPVPADQVAAAAPPVPGRPSWPLVLTVSAAVMAGMAALVLARRRWPHWPVTRPPR